MDPTIVGQIVGFASLVCDAAQALFAAANHSKQRVYCRRLAELRETILAIAETGEKIGTQLSIRTLHRDNIDAIDEFVDLLQAQQRNLKKATRVFKATAKTFDVFAPELQSLGIHLDGKGKRITLMYEFVTETRSRRRKGKIQHWETVDFVEPRQLTPLLQERTFRVEAPGVQREIDSDFQPIIDCIPRLNQLICDQCEASDLL